MTNENHHVNFIANYSHQKTINSTRLLCKTCCFVTEDKSSMLLSISYETADLHSNIVFPLVVVLQHDG